MDYEQLVKDMVARFSVTETPWRFVTSGGATFTAGTTGLRVMFAAASGALWVRNGQSRPIALNYAGVGASVGLSLVPVPVNFSFSIPAMPSAGTIYKLPFAGRTLSAGELRGALLMVELAADSGAGRSESLLFIGGNRDLAAIVGPALYSLALIATSKACVRFGGMSATVLPFNASATAYLGQIF